MNKLRLYCFDPGGTTGFAELTAYPNESTIRVIRAMEIPTFKGIESLYPPHILPGEDFVVLIEALSSQHPSFLTVGLEVSGAIKYLTYLYNLNSILRPPSMMVAAQRIHPLTEIKSAHIRDAVHHGISYVYQTWPQKFDVTINEGSILNAKKDRSRN